jgi:hypothetical protein
MDKLLKLEEKLKKAREELQKQMQFDVEPISTDVNAAKSEKELVGQQGKLDMDKDGDIEADDLAALRQKKKMKKAEHPDEKEDKKLIAEAIDMHNEKKHGEKKDKDSAKKDMALKSDLEKADKRYFTELAGKLSSRGPSEKQNYTKITSATGEHKAPAPIEPKQVVSHTEAPEKVTPGTRVEYRPQKMRTGASIYKDPETWKSESDVEKKEEKELVKSLSNGQWFL